MASITCPDCKRFVDESVKFCPGCKFNIRKYVKELKKGGGSLSTSISLGSVYSNSKTRTAAPALDFLKSAPAEPEPVAEPVQAAAPEAAPVYEPSAAVPAYGPSAPEAGTSSVTPSDLFGTAAVQPEVPGTQVYAEPATAQPAIPPEAQMYGTPAQASPAASPLYGGPTAQPTIPPEAQIYGAPAQASPAASPLYGGPAAQPTIPPEAQIYGAPAQPAPSASPLYGGSAAQPAIPPEAQMYGPPAGTQPAIPPEAQMYGPPAGTQPAIPPEAQMYGPPAGTQPAIPPEAQIYGPPAGTQAVAPGGGAAGLYGGPQPAIPSQNPFANNQNQQSMNGGSITSIGGYSGTTPARETSPMAPYSAEAQQAKQSAMEQRGPVELGPDGQPLFESESLGRVAKGGGALSGVSNRPTIMERLRAEEERKKAEESIFESASLRKHEKDLNAGLVQAGGALHSDISFTNYAAPERGSYGRVTAEQLRQAAYVAAGNTPNNGQAPYAAPQRAQQAAPQMNSPLYGGPQNVMPAFAPGGGGAPAFAPGAGSPAFAPGPGAPAFVPGGGMPAFTPGGNPGGPAGGAG
ncbi:MAG: hypothetical protein IKI75_01660 [Lachnospiraceae bacterium]|nr:hypothetical protein [Lachnospiraceae bacterium]